MEIECKEVENIKKELSELNKLEVGKLIDIICENFEKVDNAIRYNNYDKIGDCDKQIIIRHIKMAKRIIEYLKLHREYPQITASVIEDYTYDMSENDIALKISELKASEWGAINKRINIAYNICHLQQEPEKKYIKMYEASVLKLIFRLHKKVTNKKVKIKTIIKEIELVRGIKLKYNEIIKILPAIYDYDSDELKEKREEAIVKIKGLDKKFKVYFDIFKPKKDIKEEIIEKVKTGIKETELWEYITEVLKYPEEVYEKTIERLKHQGELLEPRQGFFISE